MKLLLVIVLLLLILIGCDNKDFDNHCAARKVVITNTKIGETFISYNTEFISTTIHRATPQNTVYKIWDNHYYVCPFYVTVDNKTELINAIWVDN